VSPEQALAVQRILDAIYESSRLGREVMLSEP
jgi:predicted dehydrogenase